MKSSGDMEMKRTETSQNTGKVDMSYGRDEWRGAGFLGRGRRHKSASKGRRIQTCMCAVARKCSYESRDGVNFGRKERLVIVKG